MANVNANDSEALRCEGMTPKNKNLTRSNKTRIRVCVSGRRSANYFLVSNFHQARAFEPLAVNDVVLTLR